MYYAAHSPGASGHFVVPVQVARSMDMSVLAEQVFCSIVAEMQERSKLRGLSLWPSLLQANQATSYNRTTAAGHLRRIVWHTESDEYQLLTLTLACMVEAKANDKVALQALAQLEDDPLLIEDGSLDYLNAALKWHWRRRNTLKQAAVGLKAVVPPEVWDKGISLASN